MTLFAAGRHSIIMLWMTEYAAGNGSCRRAGRRHNGAKRYCCQRRAF